MFGGQHLTGGPRAEYGSWTELEFYGKLKIRLRSTPRYLHWQHGWLPSSYNIDPDLIIGEDGNASAQRSEAFFVARGDQEIALKHFGFVAVKAIGLPFNYALANVGDQLVREPSSILVMPGGHTTDEDASGGWPKDLDYIDYVHEIKNAFGRALVLLHASDLRLGRGRGWESAGFEVREGAGFFDATSLSRLALLFQQFEFVTTNGFGSHIAYAAASGCRVSVAGPPPQPFSDPSAYTFYRKRPDLLASATKLENGAWTELEERGLLCDPLAAKTHLDWGREEIGFSHVLPPSMVGHTLRDITRFPDERWGKIANLPYAFRLAQKVRRTSSHLLQKIGRRHVSASN